MADVFDALLSTRCYKEPWPLEMVVDLFERECGYQFDPKLTKILLNHLAEFVAIRDTYPDTEDSRHVINLQGPVDLHDPVDLQATVAPKGATDLQQTMSAKSELSTV